MQGRGKKLKGQDGQYILPITHSDLVYVESNKTLTQKLGEIGTGVQEPVVSAVSKSDTSTKKPTVVFILDDLSDIHYNNLSVFTSRGIGYTGALRTDYINSSFTYAKVKELQANGIEIAYHGTKHNFTTAELEADINSYLQAAEAEGIITNGYVGPNGMYDENIVFHKFFGVFKWGRSGGTNGVASVGSPVDYFKLIPTHFIDDLTSDTSLTTLKTKIDTLSTRGTGLLALSMHLSSGAVPYLTSLLDYIQSLNISIMTASEAYETYGAIYEYYDSSLPLGANFRKRQEGNGTATYNPSSSHFILQKDGTVISNGSMVRLINPKKGNTTITGNTVPDDFDIGISIIQYGSVDSFTGFPNVGTLYNFNFGKSAGQQFQLYKSTAGGIFFREANTDNTWKSGMVNKLGVFRSTVPNSSTATGFKGDFSADANYLYVCYVDNNWIRIAKDTW